MAIKKLGSNLTVKGMVIHHLKKAAGTRLASVKNAKKVLTINDTEKVFLGKLNETYRKKSNPIHGIFGGVKPVFRDLLDAYLKDHDFFNFSIKAAAEYKKILDSTITATGGFLIFVDFTNTDSTHRYMLVLTTNNKDGYVVSEDDLTLKDIKNLDLSKVDVACMINLATWKAIEDKTDQESKTYLSFVKGHKNISYYFMDFIDCHDKTTATESTTKLTQAIDAYADFKKLDRKAKIKLKNTAFEYCNSCMKQKKEIQLSAISTLFDSDNPNDFKEFAGDEEYGVSEIIRGDSRLLRQIKYVKYKDENYLVEFDVDLIGKDIFYNREKKELTFKRIPDELADQIPR